tara:strand:- start:154 stop:525 length:372 start_codon:yes stop_codon:yes gene_type:complete
MDLSEYTKKIEVLPDKVRHTDDDTGEDKEANEVCITWKHNYLPVSELKFYLRENHEEFENKVQAREQEILEIWMKELKYDSRYFIVEDKKIKEKGKVEHQHQVETWLKPNSELSLEPTEVEEI